MLMAGCCWLGCSERGALGFSNDRSLTYCARTLSCGGAACWPPPACPPAAWPPFVGMVMGDPPDAAVRSAGWLTRAAPRHKDCGDREGQVYVLRFRPVVWFRQLFGWRPTGRLLPPFARREVDDAVAALRLAAQNAAKGRMQPALNRRQEQEEAQGIGQKTRQKQKKSADREEKAPAANGLCVAVGHADADLGNSSPLTGEPQQDDA